MRCTLPLEIWWDGFYPEDEKNWIEYKIEIDGKEILVKIGVSERPVTVDDSKDLSNACFPSEYLNLTFTIECSDDIIKKLRTSAEDEEIEEFRKEVMNIIEKLYYSIINILRNYFGQYWISPKLLRNKNVFYKAEWLDSEDWKPIFPRTIYFWSRMRLKGISKENWIKLGKLLSDKRKPDMIQVMLSNAWEHLENENYRMAIVESVTALEAALKQIDPQLFLKDDTSRISKKTISNIIDDMTFEHALSLFIELLGDRVKLNPEDYKICLSAIDTRNNIMHNRKRNVLRSDAKRIILAVSEIISALSNLFIVKHGYIAG